MVSCRENVASDTGLALAGQVRAARNRNLRADARRRTRPIRARAPPEREGDRHGIEVDPGPPRDLIAVAMQLAMMQAAQGNRELVADLAPERARLGKAQMVRLGGRAAANEAWLPGDEQTVVLVAQADGLAHQTGTFGVGLFGASLFVGGRRRLFALKAGFARLLPRRFLNGLPLRLFGPSSVEGGELRAEPGFDKARVGAG